MSLNLIIIIVVCLFVIWMYKLYCSVIQKRNKIQEAFSAIDVQLKKRYDLIPNILTIAQNFMEHEKNLMEEITKLRVQALGLSDNFENIDKKFALDSQIAQKMGEIMVAVENYPQIKSDQTMVVAMQTYNEVEEHIAAARRFYNSAALDLKNAVEVFPSSIFAKIMNINSCPFFKAEEFEKESIKANDFFNK